MRLLRFVLAIILLSSAMKIAASQEAGLGDVFTEPQQDPAHPIAQPTYPDSARRSGMEGAVIVGFVVKTNGAVDARTIHVQESSGFPILDVSAAAKAATWRFLPATSNGKPVESEHYFRVVFELTGPGPDNVGRPDFSGIRIHALPPRRVGDSPPPEPGVPLNMSPY
jgi:TonB family protein